MNAAIFFSLFTVIVVLVACLIYFIYPAVHRYLFLWSHSYCQKETPELDGFVSIEVEDPAWTAAMAREMERNRRLMKEIEAADMLKAKMKKERDEEERKIKEEKERKERLELEARERAEEERLKKFFTKFMAEKEKAVEDVDKMFDEWKKEKEKI